jgi:hypothetical protein
MVSYPALAAVGSVLTLQNRETFFPFRLSPEYPNLRALREVLLVVVCCISIRVLRVASI